MDVCVHGPTASNQQLLMVLPLDIVPNICVVMVIVVIIHTLPIKSVNITYVDGTGASVESSLPEEFLLHLSHKQEMLSLTTTLT